jgi:hypothetical protein
MVESAGPRGSTWVAAVADEYRSLRSLAERAAAQVDDAQFFASLDSDANSIAALMKHVAGNLRSRWQDFRTTDGEKPDRRRDEEFEPSGSRAEIEAIWQGGWGVLEAALSSLTEEDLSREVTIRGEAISLPRAVTRNLAHTAGHVHQLVLLARHWAGPSWQTLSIPRGESEPFRLRMAVGAGVSEPKAPSSSNR